MEICNRNTNGISGLCLEIHDLIVSKLYAAREKDIDFFHAAVSLRLVSKDPLLKRLADTCIPIEVKESILKRIEKGFQI